MNHHLIATSAIMGTAMQLIGGSVRKGLESLMKGRKVTKITDIARKKNSYESIHVD